MWLSGNLFLGNGEAPNNDESLINVLTHIDNIDLVENDKAQDKVKSILAFIDD